MVAGIIKEAGMETDRITCFLAVGYHSQAEHRRCEQDVFWCHDLADKGFARNVAQAAGFDC